MHNKINRVLLACAALLAAALACSLPGGPLFEDDFSNTDKWGTGTDSDSAIEYADGGLQMQVYTEDLLVWSTPDAEPFENVHIEVTIKNNDTDPLAAFGIICNEQAYTDSYYMFAITPTGEYAIIDKSLALDNVFLTNDGEWVVSDLITPEKDSYRLGADCGNGTLTLYVDGQQIDSVADDSYTSGNVGLFVWSESVVNNVDVIFDDFVVTALK